MRNHSKALALLKGNEIKGRGVTPLRGKGRVEYTQVVHPAPGDPSPGARVELHHILCRLGVPYQRFLVIGQRRAKPAPASPRANRVRDAGSGTTLR